MSILSAFVAILLQTHTKITWFLKEILQSEVGFRQFNKEIVTD
jgi:hypothetical protein